jgi:RNA polymerase sigma-70 factor (ECF subfamily)
VDKAFAPSLTAALARARSAWPGVVVPDDEFFAYVETKLRGADVAELPVADLYLALGCARGDAAALKGFAARYFADVAPQLARMKLPADVADEVIQILNERFFVPPPGEPARILALAGNGDLGALVRVAAVRTALNLRRRDHRLEPDTDEAVLAAIEPATGPELAVMKEHHRVELKRVLENAIAGLDARDKNVLRLHLIHRLSIDDIGSVYQVHRATAARWLERIRAHIQDVTRDAVRSRFGLDEDGCNSLIRLVESRLDISFERVLGAG